MVDSLKVPLEILNALNSKIRLQIMAILQDNAEGLTFSTLTEKLSISATVLEHHLKRLVKKDLISHIDRLYTPNLLTFFCLDEIHQFNQEGLIPFFSTHWFPIQENTFHEKLLQCQFQVIPNIISIMSAVKDNFSYDFSTLRMAGGYNLSLEKQSMQFMSADLFKIYSQKDVQIIFSKADFDQFLNSNEKKYFFQDADLKQFQIYLIDECRMEIGIFGNMAVLFLPLITGQIDYNQALGFSTPEGINWINSLFEYLLKKSQKLSLQEIVKIMDRE